MRWPGEQLLKLNLDALRTRNPGLADTIAAESLPDNVAMVVARDGSVTFLISDQAGRAHWLGFSSVPIISARANADLISVDATNLAFNGIGHGAEAQFLLEKLAPYQAIIVTETDLLHLNLVLRLRDFSGDLAAGRLVLLLGCDPAGLLEDFLRDHPGYNIASQTITWTWLTLQENQEYAEKLTRATEHYLGEILNTVNSLLSQQKERDRDTLLQETRQLLSGGNLSSLRAANYVNSYHPTDYFTSRDALAGLAQLGICTNLLALNRPDIVSNHAHITRLNDCKPHVIILVDMLRRDVGFRLPEDAICVTLLREPSAKMFEPGGTSRLGPYDFIFPVFQHQLQKLHDLGFAANRTHQLFLAADTELFHPYQPSNEDCRTYAADVALVAERHDTDPAAWQISLPTHQRLWQEILSLIRHEPERYHCDIAGQYLTRAQKCGVVLREADMLQHFTELIRNYLAPTVLRDSYSAALDEAGLNLRIWNPISLTDTVIGRRPCFWSDSPVKHLHAGPVIHGRQSNTLYNCAKISLHIAGSNLITSDMLEAVAAGSFCLVKSNPDEGSPDAIGNFFDLGSELITFDTAKDLIRKVHHYLDREDERQEIAAAARKKLLVQHSAKQRMRQMLDIIRDNLPT